MPPTSTPKEAAEAFISSYADAMELSLQPHASLETCAHALASHYSSKTTAFTHGHVLSTPPSTPDFWLTGIITHLKRFDKAGLGWRIRLKASRVHVLSDSAAACFVTWEIEPAQGEGWCWENVYGWRRGGEGDGMVGWWEYIVSDNEVGELVKRVPGFWELEV
ncbi:hypothetical protein Q7P37_007146 [Cladosporium fusiforme]